VDVVVVEREAGPQLAETGLGRAVGEGVGLVWEVTTWAQVLLCLIPVLIKPIGEDGNSLRSCVSLCCLKIRRRGIGVVVIPLGPKLQVLRAI
jgi:hypothetical protein